MDTPTVSHPDRERPSDPQAPTLQLPWNVLEAVIKTIGSIRAESGGPLGGHEGATDVGSFHFDESSRTSSVTYSPDFRALNRLFKATWNPAGIRLRGFIHSHPGSSRGPSSGDLFYAERILEGIEDLPLLWLPIVNTVPDTDQFRLTPWAVTRTKKGVRLVRGVVCIAEVPENADLEVNGELVHQNVATKEPLAEIVVGRARRTSVVPFARPTEAKEAAGPAESAEHGGAVAAVAETGRDTPSERFDEGATFDRVRSAYDLDLMAGSSVIAIGAGGAAESLEQLARAGLGRFVLLDPDTVSETNLATQQVYRRDIGRPKVQCIAERLRDINPNVEVVALQKSLDELSDEQIRSLAEPTGNRTRPGKVVLCGLTDSFFAQARVNRLALTLGLPSLCAQVYQEGRGAEITFTYPGVTPACHRCALASRYRHVIEHGEDKAVTSHGTPIFATARLNALKGFLILALIHHGSGHPRWGNVLARAGERNLVQIRMDPDFGKTVGITVFDRVFEYADNGRLFFDEAVWLPQKPDCPENGYPTCPDCGGTGDLRDAVNRFADTRVRL